MTTFEYTGPPIDEATRNAAWRRIVVGLQEIGGAPEVLRAAGAWQFVYRLEEMCQDISENLSADSYDEAMQKLVAGFGRATGQQPHARTMRFKAMARQEWSDNRGGGYKTKTGYAADFAKRLDDEFHHVVSMETIRDRWLAGLPA